MSSSPKIAASNAIFKHAIAANGIFSFVSSLYHSYIFICVTRYVVFICCFRNKGIKQKIEEKEQNKEKQLPHPLSGQDPYENDICLWSLH